MNTIIPPNKDEFKFITKKQFKVYLGFKNNKTVKKHYLNYLFAVGKKENLLLTNFDIFKIDGVKI